jgi:hypothetical protein
VIIKSRHSGGKIRRKNTMKNTNKKALKAMLILAMLVTLCMSLAACAQTTETGTTDPIVLELVNVGLDILAKAAIAAIGLAGAWATAKIGQNNKLANIKAAIGQVTQAAQTTVGELQQTTVEAMKAAAADGKLTEDTESRSFAHDQKEAGGAYRAAAGGGEAGHQRHDPGRCRGPDQSDAHDAAADRWGTDRGIRRQEGRPQNAAALRFLCRMLCRRYI